MFLIAATGWGQQEDKARAIASGFDHHLTKPVDPDEVQKLLQAFFRWYLGTGTERRTALLREMLGLLVRFLVSFSDIAELRLTSADGFVDRAFDLLGLIASQLAEFLLDFSAHLFCAPFNLILIDTHMRLLLIHSSANGRIVWLCQPLRSNIVPIEREQCQ